MAQVFVLCSFPPGLATSYFVFKVQLLATMKNTNSCYSLQNKSMQHIDAHKLTVTSNVLIFIEEKKQMCSKFNLQKVQTRTEKLGQQFRVQFLQYYFEMNQSHQGVCRPGLKKENKTSGNVKIKCAQLMYCYFNNNNNNV